MQKEENFKYKIIHSDRTGFRESDRWRQEKRLNHRQIPGEETQSSRTGHVLKYYNSKKVP